MSKFVLMCFLCYLLLWSNCTLGNNNNQNNNLSNFTNYLEEYYHYDHHVLRESLSLGNLQIFPQNDAWHQDISSMEVDAHSDEMINNIGSSVQLHPDFGTIWNNAPIGIPYNLVGGNQKKINITFDYTSESDPGPYPIPADVLIEGGGGNGDRHILIIDTENKKLYEIFHAYINTDGSWHAGSGAVFDLTLENPQRPDGYTSADAAGLAIFPGLIRYEEVLNGEMNHAIRFTLQNSIVRHSFVHPATHSANPGNNSTNQVPMGARLRLKAGFNTSSFSPHIQVILNAMKKYGLILADNGSNMYISGAPDPRWDDDQLRELRDITAGDFEVVKLGTMYHQSDY